MTAHGRPHWCAVMTKVAIIGTGPTGTSLASELRKTAPPCALLRAAWTRSRGCFLTCSREVASRCSRRQCDLARGRGLRSRLRLHWLALHPVTARNIASALRHTRACQVSSYWAHYPKVRAEMDEESSAQQRAGLGAPPARGQDILCEVGGAILHLPDF